MKQNEEEEAVIFICYVVPVLIALAILFSIV